MTLRMKYRELLRKHIPRTCGGQNPEYVPDVLTDFSSRYPTVNSLLGNPEGCEHHHTVALGQDNTLEK